MICRNCCVELDDTLEKCPFCGTKVELKKENNTLEEEKNSDFELPVLKNEEEYDEIVGDIQNVKSEDDFEVSLEKTRSISPIEDNSEMNSLSLIDDINKQIDAINEEKVLKFASENKEKKEDSDQEKIHNELETKDSIKSRKNILLIMGILCLIVALVLFGIFLFTNKKEEAISGANYIDNLKESLQRFYDTGEIDGVIYVLEDVKKDNEKIKEVQKKTRTICDSWVLLYLNEEIMDKDKFDEVSNKYRSLIDGLHNDAIIKYEDIRIKALNDTDYGEISKQINDIYSDSSLFLEAFSYYNAKDYNRAYYDFDRINEKNFYYEKALSYKNKIVDNILELLNNDIRKLEANIDSLTDEEKLQIYVSIEEIILEYNNVYVGTNLSSNKDYQEILGIYTSNVSLYTDKVSNKENSVNNGSIGNQGNNDQSENNNLNANEDLNNN